MGTRFSARLDRNVVYVGGVRIWKCCGVYTDVDFHHCINPLTPNDPYRGRTAPLTSKRCILYIYSTNIGTEYFKYGVILSVSFSSKCGSFHNSNIFGSCFIHILYTGCAKIKKNNSGAKRLRVFILRRTLTNRHCDLIQLSLNLMCTVF